MLGANFDRPTENRAFKEQFTFPYDLLSDVDQEVGTVYGVLSTEHSQYPAKISYLIDPEGHIEQVFPQVQPNTHSDQKWKDL